MICVTLILYTLCISLVIERSVAARTFIIEHSLDGGASFRKRSSFLHNSAGDISLQEESNESILQEEVELFKNLLSTNSMYVLRIHNQDNDFASESVYASIPSCELQKSNFKEDISLHMDRDGGIVGLHLTSPVIALPRACDPRKIADDKGVSFQSKVRAVEPMTAGVIPVQATGPRPPSLANVKLDVEEESADAAKQEAGQQSFLRKYWYIVLPMVIFTLFGGAEPEPGAADKGSAAAAPAAAGK